MDKRHLCTTCVPLDRNYFVLYVFSVFSIIGAIETLLIIWRYSCPYRSFWQEAISLHELSSPAWSGSHSPCPIEFSKVPIANLALLGFQIAGRICDIDEYANGLFMLRRPATAVARTGSRNI